MPRSQEVVGTLRVDALNSVGGSTTSISLISRYFIGIVTVIAIFLVYQDLHLFLLIPELPTVNKFNSKEAPSSPSLSRLQGRNGDKDIVRNKPFENQRTATPLMSGIHPSLSVPAAYIPATSTRTGHEMDLVLSEPQETCKNAKFFREAARLHSILPDQYPAPLFSKSSSSNPTFHPNIDIVRPPSLVLASNDSHTDHIVAIWDMFVREKTLTIIFARYMESYGCGLYDHIHIVLSSHTSNSKTNRNILKCVASKSDQGIDIIEESKYDPLSYRRVSVDAIRICRINIIPYVEHHHRDAPLSVAINYLGFVKNFPSLIPIERAYPHSYGTGATESQLVVSTLLGDKPRHSMTTLITWLRYHHRLGVQQVFVYLMQPVQWLIPGEEVRELNEYISSLESAGGSRLRLTFVDWPSLFFNTSSNLISQHPRGCSQLAIIQSNLYRIRRPLFGFDGSRIDMREKTIAQNVTKWMLECDIDDYIKPRSPNRHFASLDDAIKPQRDMLLSVSTSRAIALEFHNRYCYIISANATQDILDIAQQSLQAKRHAKVENASKAVDDEAMLRKFIIPGNNITWGDLANGTIIFETDGSLHRYRPKLIYNVEEVMLGGPHRIDMSRIGGYVQHDTGFYLHFLQGSLGRDIDMIERPGVISLKGLSSY